MMSGWTSSSSEQILKTSWESVSADVDVNPEIMMSDSRFDFFAMSTYTAETTSTFDKTAVDVRGLEVSAASLAVILAYV
jgi:hypothetical protein